LTELVRSLTVGATENVPIARNCPLSVKAPKTIPLGMMVSERILSPLLPPVPLEPVTVRTALEEVGPLNAVAVAVIVVVPALTAVATPEALTVATAGVVEVQVTRLVTFWVEGCFALP
jgi:hypothetical protein